MGGQKAFHEAEVASEDGCEKDIERVPFHAAEVNAVSFQDREHAVVTEVGRHADGGCERFDIPDFMAGDDFL